MASVIHKLGWALECQLERDSDLSFIEYHALARLSEEPTGTLRMSELAVLTNASLSRLSHLVTRLEKWGFVRREPDTTDGRYTKAILTKAGYAKLATAPPDMSRQSGNSSFDEFSPAELDQAARAFASGSSPASTPRPGSSRSPEHRLREGANSGKIRTAVPG